jgi:hypothetical protein
MGNSPFHRGSSAKWPCLLLPLDRERTVAARGYPAALEDGGAGNLKGEKLG